MNTINKTIALIIILITVYWSFSDMIPSYSNDETSLRPQEFSVNNALQHLKNISHKAHSVGTEEHKKVQQYLVTELEKLGLEPEVQVATVFNKKWVTGTTVENIIARIKGSSNGKSLLLLSHYDSNPHSSIGAADAGSGIVTILEGVRAYLSQNKTPKNDIIIVFSDAEELGLLGAEAFVKHHPYASNIGLVLNFEARGSGGPSYMLMETNGKNSELLKNFQNTNTKFPAANSLMYSVYKMLPNDTDLTVFREKANINGFNFAFIGDHFDYHTAQDSYDRLDRASLAHQGDYLMGGLNYFSEADLTNLNSNKDYVYVNFPFIKLLTYPFSWILPLILIASLVFGILIFYGVKKEKNSISGIFIGFIPFSLALIFCVITNIALWKLLLYLYPEYKDMLHGFTYNGYYYIAAFSFLNIWIVFTIFNFFKYISAIDLFVAPITIWLLISFLLYLYLPGGAFLIIPVYFALIVLAILVFKNNSARPILITFISIPTIYIFSPLIKMFPVGLGLKNLFISAFFIVLTLGLLIPVFHEKHKKNSWAILSGFVAILLFIISSINSGFSVDKKKPNSLVYVQNLEDKSAFWGTYNHTLDDYTRQIFDNGFSEGSIANADTKNKYNRKFNFYKKASFKNLKTSEIAVTVDTTIGNEREILFTIMPQRKINKFELFNNVPLTLSFLSVNNAVIYDTVTTIQKETLLIYHMSNTDKEVQIKMKFQKDEHLHITLNEISNDLLTNSTFNLQPRSEIMMPMPFVTNDAIISSKTLTFD